MRYTLIVAAVLGVAVGCLYGYYRYKFPYGSVHRCSKTLATLLNSYAQDHEGHFPQADDVRQLGMEKVLDAEGTHLDLVVGKAGDLAEAERFYKKNGYSPCSSYSPPVDYPAVVPKNLDASLWSF